MEIDHHKNTLHILANGFNQVALVVPDLEKAVEQYWGAFGIGPWQFYTYGKPLVRRMSYHGRPADYRMRLALAQVGSLNIELIEMVEGETVYADFVAKHGYGVHHLGVPVENMGAALAAAKQLGVDMLQDGSGFGVDGDGHFAYLNTEDRIGVTIELREAPRRRHPPERVYPPT